MYKAFVHLPLCVLNEFIKSHLVIGNATLFAANNFSGFVYVCVFVLTNLSTCSCSLTSRHRNLSCFGICLECLEIMGLGKGESAQQGTPDDRQTCLRMEYSNSGRAFHFNVKQFHILKHVYQTQHAFS